MKLRWDHPLWRRLAPALAQAYLRTCPATTQIGTEVHKLMLSGRPLIYTLWHCQLLYPLYYVRRYYLQLPPLVVMASPSRDGEFIGEVARRLGFKVCFGSRRKGGVQALHRLADFFRQGYSCGLIADGSRGPARVAQKGPLYLARVTGAPLIPLAVAAKRKATFNTWDRFELPLPFSRLAVLFGEPLQVLSTDRGKLLEERRRMLETRLNLLYDQSQKYFSKN
ncbi:MAG: lysophospholipid acyltransferase family protein [Thermodesulfobacteriota bacterium]